MEAKKVPVLPNSLLGSISWDIFTVTCPEPDQSSITLKVLEQAFLGCKGRNYSKTLKKALTGGSKIEYKEFKHVPQEQHPKLRCGRASRESSRRCSLGCPKGTTRRL